MTVFFSERPDRATSRTRSGCDLDAHAAWCRELLARGVYPPPSQFEAWFPSLAHTPAQIERHGGGGRRGFAEAAAGARGERSDALERLAALLRDEGGLLATLVDAATAAPARVRATIARPRSSPPARAREGRRAEYELLVEAIYEGYLLHYGAPRVVRSAEADLRLLAGDRLYAIGLARLVALGDTARGGRAGRHDHALRARAGRRASRRWPRRCGAPARAPSAGAPATRTARPRSWSSRGPPEAVEAMRTSAAARAGAALNPASILFVRRCQTSTPSTSPSTRSTARSPAPSRARRSPAGGS